MSEPVVQLLVRVKSAQTCQSLNCAIVLMWANQHPSRGSAWWIWLFSSYLAFPLA